LMTDGKAVLSGSFILQVILSEDWNQSDIDIFIPVEGICSEEWKDRTKSLPWFSPFEIFAYTSMSEEIGESGDQLRPHGKYFIQAETKISRTVSFDLDGKLLQLIAIRLLPDFDFIKNFLNGTFDLDVCKNFFSYQKDQNDGNIRPILHISYLMQIITKQTFYRMTEPNHRCIDRIIKYKKRGFEVIENPIK
jgi:hypothetical protein